MSRIIAFGMADGLPSHHTAYRCWYNYVIPQLKLLRFALGFVAKVDGMCHTQTMREGVRRKPMVRDDHAASTLLKRTTPYAMNDGRTL